MNQFRLVTMIARTTPVNHNPRITAQNVTYRLREIGERPSYTMHVLYAAFLFWPSICVQRVVYEIRLKFISVHTCSRSLPFEFNLGTTCCHVVFMWYIGYC